MTEATPEQVRQITHDVLSRPEFSDKTTWTQLVSGHVMRWLDSFARWSARNPDLARLLTFVLMGVLGLLIAHLIYVVVREFGSLRKTDRRTSHGHLPRALEGVAENWDDAFALARAALDASDLYRTLWITHRVLLSVLDHIGQIKFVRWKTNSDYLHECRDAGAAGATLSEVTAAYERVIYAHTEFDHQRARNLLAQVEALAVEAGR